LVIGSPKDMEAVKELWTRELDIMERHDQSQYWSNSNKGIKCDIEIRAARTLPGGASAVYEPVGSTPVSASFAFRRDDRSESS
jgi:hypothetical protein